MVEVHLFAAARAAVGHSSVAVAPGTLADLLDGLERTSPAFGKVRPQCSFLIDGISIHDEPALIDVAPGQRVDVLPPFAGG
jgi:molybdopterin synthase sulfur carrier subunit